MLGAHGSETCVQSSVVHLQEIEARNLPGHSDQCRLILPCKGETITRTQYALFRIWFG